MRGRRTLDSAADKSLDTAAEEESHSTGTNTAIHRPDDSCSGSTADLDPTRTPDEDEDGDEDNMLVSEPSRFRNIRA